MVTWPSSSGCRSTSRTCRLNSGRSSRKGTPGWEESGDTVDFGGLDRLLQAEGWENGRQALGQHRLPRPRGTDEQDVVPSRRGPLEAPFGMLLSPDIGKVDRILGGLSKRRLEIDAGGLEGDLAVQDLDRLGEALHPVNLDPLDDGGLRGVVDRRE